MAEETKDQSSGRTGRARTPFTFGVSGHRDLVATDLPELRKQLRRIFDHFRTAYPDTSFRLLSPLAEGADRLAAEVALASEVQVWVPMPMPQPEYERDFTTPESLAEFRLLLGLAHAQWDINNTQSDRPPTVDPVNRPQKYAAVGDYIAQKSHVLILLWDGRHNQKVGGTSWVKTRREKWMREGVAPDPFGYVGTIHVVTPRETAAVETQQRQRVEIVGELPLAQADVRSKL